MYSTLNDTRQNIPPRAAATDLQDSVFSATTAAVAASTDLWAGYAADTSAMKSPQGMCWIEIEALTTDVYLRFCRTALAATTQNTGACVKVGTPRRFFLDPRKDLFMDQISTGAGVVKWRRCGAIVERTRQ